jgi:hypothetical protein
MRSTITCPVTAFSSRLQLTVYLDLPKSCRQFGLLKKKASGRYKARIIARGFEQKDGEHFDSTDKTSPVVNDITISIVLTIIVMAGFWAEVVDVNGAFLTAEIDPKHTLYVTVPQGLEKYYPGNVVLLLKRTLFGVGWTTL